MSNIDKIVIFDFDSTLVNTMNAEDGKRIWAEKMGEPFPKGSWWASRDSLNTEIFDHPVNEWIKNYYDIHTNEPNSVVYLVTGRIKRMEDGVRKILDKHALSFKDVLCNPTHDTYSFKIGVYEQKIKEYPNATELIMYDDRAEHLVKFVEWAKVQPIKITIIDSINQIQLIST